MLIAGAAPGYGEDDTMTTIMRGFPPTDDARVTLANWRLPTFNRWAFHHVREIVPSADIPNDPDDIEQLPAQPLDTSGPRIADRDRVLSFDEFLTASHTDGFAVIHRGRLVVERYANGMTPDTPHILMSVSKSMLGLLAGALAAKGVLDVDRPATDIVPELLGTAYKGVTVRQLLDMRAGVAFDEDYLATSGPIVNYRKATNWNPLEPGETPSDLRSFYGELTQSDGPHGGRFHYISPNTDLLGWIIERAADRRYADLMSELIWRPMGATRSAYITVDRFGAPRCAGGMCTALRDLALVGQLIARNGARGARQIIPEAWIADILDNGDPAAWDKGPFVEFFPGRTMHYRTKWYVDRGGEPLMFGLGIHGQYLFVDRKRDLAIAKFSSQPLPLDGAGLALMLSGVEAIRRAL